MSTEPTNELTRSIGLLDAQRRALQQKIKPSPTKSNPPPPFSNLEGLLINQAQAEFNLGSLAIKLLHRSIQNSPPTTEEWSQLTELSNKRFSTWELVKEEVDNRTSQAPK